MKIWKKYLKKNADEIASMVRHVNDPFYEEDFGDIQFVSSLTMCLVFTCIFALTLHEPGLSMLFGGSSGVLGGKMLRTLAERLNRIEKKVAEMGSVFE